MGGSPAVGGVFGLSAPEFMMTHPRIHKEMMESGGTDWSNPPQILRFIGSRSQVLTILPGGQVRGTPKKRGTQWRDWGETPTLGGLGFCSGKVPEVGFLLLTMETRVTAERPTCSTSTSGSAKRNTACHKGRVCMSSEHMPPRVSVQVCLSKCT